MKKKIKVLYRGPIYEKGGIYGPITTPYLEDVKTISRFLLSGKKVSEVLDDGTEISLDLTNFNTDNSNQKPVVNEVKEVVTTEKVCTSEGCEIKQPEIKDVIDPIVTETEEILTKENETPVEISVPVVDVDVSNSDDNMVDEENDDDVSNEENDENHNSDNNDNPFKRIKKNKNRNR